MDQFQISVRAGSCWLLVLFGIWKLCVRSVQFNWGRGFFANEACDAGRVLVNGSVAKASVKVKVGDIIEIQFGTRTVKVEVLDIQETTKKEEAKDLFKYL